MNIPFIKTNNGFTALIDGKPYNIAANHPNYNILFKSVKDGDEKSFTDNLTEDSKLTRVINNAPALVNAGVKFKDGEVTYKGVPLAGLEVDRIKKYALEKIPFESILRFIENRMENPSPEALKQLYAYIEKHELPLTVDGCFLAYKSIRQDWKDKYSGTISNHIGAVVTMTRSAVDSDSNKHCSSGLHVGALAYSGPQGWYHSSGDRVVYCKINPRDVISVPNDHSGQKMRVCKYEVVGEYVDVLAGSNVYNNDKALSSEDWEDDEVWEDDFEDVDIEDVVKREKVSAYSLKVGDNVEFSYNGTIRMLVVEDVDDENVSGYLYINEEDLWSSIVASEVDGKHKYQTFKKERMRGVYQLS